MKHQNTAKKRKVKKKKNNINKVVVKPKTDYSGVIDYIFVPLLFLVFLFIYGYMFDHKLDINGDNYNYINYGYTILEGKGYASPYSPAFNATNWYPPGYSVILSAVMAFVGKNIVLLKWLNGLFFIASITLWYLWVIRVTQDRVMAIAVSVFLVFNTGLLRLSTIVMSEMPYLFFTLLAFYAISYMYERYRIDLSKRKHFYLLLFAVIAAFYTRSIGITLIAALIIQFLFTKRWKLAAQFSVGALILYVPWIIRNQIHGIKGRYLHTISVVNPWRPESDQVNSWLDLVNKLQENLSTTILKGFTEVMFPFIKIQEVRLFHYVGLSLCLIVIFYGVWRLKKYRILIGCYLLGNMSILLLWHSGNGSRYVWPLTPLLLFCFLYGIKGFVSSIIPKISYLFLLGSVLFGLLMVPELKRYRQIAKQSYRPAYQNYFAIGKRMKQKNLKDVMVICRKPGMFHFHSETFVSSYKFSKKHDEVIQDLIDKNTDYVVLEQLGYSSTSLYLYPAVKANMDLFKVVEHLKNPDTYLLKFDKDKAKQKFKVE